MTALVIGIERGPDNTVSEDEILSFFDEQGLDHDDDFIFSEDARFGYFIIEKANYLIFRQVDGLSLFTDAVVRYIRTLNDSDCVVVKEESEEVVSFNSDDNTLFRGSATAFVGFWDTLDNGGEEE